MEKERGIRCRATGMGWLYEWASNGILKKVIRPDGRPVEFRYDALGRRTAKQYLSKVTRWVWDGNVPLHEWSYKVTNMQSDKEENTSSKEPTEDITTWVFEAGTFVPTAKIQHGKQYSIVSDYLGTPIQMYDEQGNKTWSCSLNIYGKVLAVNKGMEFDCPFRFQGQYADKETGLYYNRFRYYNSDIGNYITQDPIRLLGGNNLYMYVSNSNTWIDFWGLEKIKNKVDGDKREAIALTILRQEHPNAIILKERYLRNSDGVSIRDVGIEEGGTGERRRVDFVVVEDGKAIRVIEVTSPTASKDLQFEKEERIRQKAKVYVREPGKKGNQGLYDISNVKTERMNIDLNTSH